MPFKAVEGLPELHLFDTYYSRNALWEVEDVAYSVQGMTGVPVPYRFCNDDTITGALLVSFLLIVWMLAGSWRYLANYARSFFSLRERENLFAVEGENDFRGGYLFIFQTCFLLAILFFDHVQEHLHEVFLHVSPYKVLGVTVMELLIYYTFKIFLYNVVNNVFFERWRCRQWNQDYMLNVLGLGLALFPLVLLVVYFDLDYALMRTAFFCILIIVKILLLYRCLRIFFNAAGLSLHLFLYFCTLEMAPLLILWRSLLFANYYLTTVY